jgi:tRNA(Arg) A34 adenosine deaminase TadA
MTDETLMGHALRLAESALKIGEPPFGAIVVAPDGAILAAGHDTVCTSRDWTRHAEIEVVRTACRNHGPDLQGCALVTTVEPCPMCFTSAWLVRISRIVYGATMADVDSVTAGQQRELGVPAVSMNELSHEPLKLVGGVRREECLALFHGVKRSSLTNV